MNSICLVAFPVRCRCLDGIDGGAVGRAGPLEPAQARVQRQHRAGDDQATAEQDAREQRGDEGDARSGVDLDHAEVESELLRIERDRKSTRLNSSHVKTSYAVFCLKKTTK